MHTVWLLNSPWWPVVTDFFMPGAAIVFSGWLAVHLQRTEYKRQEGRRQKDDADRRSEDLLQRQGAVIALAAEEHGKIVELALASDELSRFKLLHMVGLTQANVLISNVPLGLLIGQWLGRKRTIAMKYINEQGSGTENASAINSYFHDVHTLLSFWRLGVLDRAWFEADVERMSSGTASIEAERAAFQAAIKALPPFSKPYEGQD
ncbi:hypothetical protein C5C03_06500 [Clavibacter michiganensis]|nr:hypothetical protein C5C03_06500 [Clavibacter michiganensis]PPF96270.1 hypothetical protein C5C05_07380 [Clavibacter michiganensis]